MENKHYEHRGSRGGLGPIGYCICPKCGTVMLREGSEEHKAFLEIISEKNKKQGN